MTDNRLHTGLQKAGGLSKDFGICSVINPACALIQCYVKGKIKMDIADIYGKFDQIGCLTFATIDTDTPQTRIAHLFAYDHEGLYFRTMITKVFYD